MQRQFALTALDLPHEGPVQTGRVSKPFLAQAQLGTALAHWAATTIQHPTEPSRRAVGRSEDSLLCSGLHLSECCYGQILAPSLLREMLTNSGYR